VSLPLGIRKLIYRDYFGAGFRVHERLGARWLLHYRNHVDRKLILKRPFEAEQLAWFSAQMAQRQCRVFIDVGANFGLYTIYLLRHCPGLSQVFAVEPQARNYHQLCSNVLLNDFSPRVKAFAWGASNGRRSVEFLENKGSSTGMSRIAETAPQATRRERFNTVTIEVDALDSLLPPLVGETIAMKIDVEGHELAVLEGARQLLQNNACLLQIEVLDQDPARLERLRAEHGLTEIHRIDCDVYLGNEALLNR
jgi:FkbM family methyltransferase